MNQWITVKDKQLQSAVQVGYRTTIGFLICGLDSLTLHQGGQHMFKIPTLQPTTAQQGR